MALYYLNNKVKFAAMTLLLLIITQLTYAQKIFTPASSNTLSGGATYCQGTTAGILIYSYNTCFTGSGSSSGTPITIKWFQNTTNSTTGGTLVSMTLVNCATGATGNTSYQPATTNPGTFYYYTQITWNGSGTCNTSGSLTSSTAAVIINAQPDVITGNNVACPGSSQTLSNTVSGGTWTSNNVVVATVSPTGVVTGLSTGTSTITYTIGTCRSTRSFSVVSAPPAITGTNTVCVGAVTSFSNTTAGGTWSTSDASIATVDASSPVHITGVTAGTSTISYVITPTCYAVRPVTVNVTPGPVTGASSACQGVTVSLGNSVSGGTWSSSTPAKATVNATTGVLNALAAGTSAISYTIGSCKSGVTFTVNIIPATIGGTLSTACEGATITLTDGVGGGTWSSANTAIASANASSGAITGTGAGTTTISYAIGSCYTTKSVTINTQPAAIGGATSGCVGSTVTLDNSTGGGTWSSVTPARATISAAGVVTPVANGTSVISYTLGSCASSITFTSMVTPAAIGGTSSTVCQGSTRTYTNTSAGGSWSSNNTAIATVNAATGVITGVAPGVATITYATGCGAPATRSITVIAMPAAIAGSTALCTGITASLSNTVSGGIWTSGTSSIASIDAATGNVTPVTAGTSVISYTIGGLCGTSTTVTVNTQPAAIAGGVALLCTPRAVTLTNAVTGGIWSSSNTALVTVNASTGVARSAGSGIATISYSIANCVSTTPITSSVTPSAVISSAVVPCMNMSTSIVVTGTPGASITYNVDGGSSLTQPLTGGSYSISTGIMSSLHIYHLISITDGICPATIDTTITVTPIRMQWVGGTPGHELAWETAANWSCGFVPDSTTDVFISGGTVTDPKIATGTIAAVNKLEIAHNAILNAYPESILRIKDSFINNGILAGDGITYLCGTAPQPISGKGVVWNITIDNAMGAFICPSSRVSLKRTLNLVSGTFHTGDSLVLTSDYTATARVAAIHGNDTISGKVRVEQYIPAGYRRYRFWSQPFNAPISLSQVQKYIDITGQGGSSNGFTSTSSNAASAFRFDPYTSNSTLGYDPGWKPFTKISASAADSNKLHPYQGIRLFMRGSKGEGLGYAFTYTPSPVTIAITGYLNQGTKVVTLEKGVDETQDYNLLGNPYASPVDIGTVLYNAKQAGAITGSAFYVWNPSLGAGGQYLAIPIGNTSAIPYSLQGCAAFQVRAAHDGDQLIFSESNKTASADNALFKMPGQNLSISVYDSAYHLWDMLHIQANSDATANDDNNYDAAKRTGADFNLYSISADGHHLAIDARPYDDNTIIPLGVNSIYAQDFIFKVNNAGDTPMYLHDKLLQKYTLMETGTEYKFSITREKETQGDDRFELTRNKPGTTSGKLHVLLTPNPASEDVSIACKTGTNEQVSIRILDLSGVSVYENTSVQGNGSVKVQLSNLPAGIYMVEVTAGDEKSVKKLVKE